MNSLPVSSSVDHRDCPASADAPEIPIVDLSSADLDWDAQRGADRITAELWATWWAGRTYQPLEPPHRGPDDFDQPYYRGAEGGAR